MTIANKITFSPGWFSPPGDTISDILEERGISLATLATAIDCSPEFLEKLINGAERITTQIAKKLEQALGATSEFWLSREIQFREDVKRLKPDVSHFVVTEWLDGLPIAEMEKFGWITRASNIADRYSECLSFFRCSTIDGWQAKYANTPALAAFRTSLSFPADLGAVAAWIQEGENRAAAIDCEPYNAQLFRQELQNLRLVTRQKAPELFISELQTRCRRCGVVVVILRTPAGCRASGATKYIYPDKALLLLSFRYLSDDHFWFSFFHEAGHLLLHEEKVQFIEGETSMTSKEEDEANAFAADWLIPKEYESELLRLPVDGIQVMRFAKRIGISPGIVVGQLQHRGRLSRRQLNNLKRRYSWIEP